MTGTAACAGADKGGVPKERDVIDIDTTVPHPARVYDYLLGGVDTGAEFGDYLVVDLHPAVADHLLSDAP